MEVVILLHKRPGGSLNLAAGQQSQEFIVTSESNGPDFVSSQRFLETQHNLRPFYKLLIW